MFRIIYEMTIWHFETIIFQIQGTNLKQHRSMPDSFMDEVTAILLNAGTQMLSLERLTQQYNKFFSSTSGKFSMAELTDALKKLPNIEVSALATVSVL